MERRAVVDARCGQSQEVADVLRRLVRKELDGDRAGATSRGPRDMPRAAPPISGERLRLRGRRVADRRRCESRSDPCGRPFSSAGASEIFWTTSRPSETRPKIVYLPCERRLIGDADEELRTRRCRACRAGAPPRRRLASASRCWVQLSAHRARRCRTAPTSPDPSISGSPPWMMPRRMTRWKIVPS